jgi:hypothetical protein
VCRSASASATERLLRPITRNAYLPIWRDATPPEGVAPRLYRPTVDVIAEARRQGFELDERVLGDAWVWGWSRGDDDRWPCFRERQLAVSWMDDWLRRIGVFE